MDHMDHKWVTIIVFVICVGGLFVLWLQRERRPATIPTTQANPQADEGDDDDEDDEDENDDEDDEDVAALIRDATSVDELMEVAGKYFFDDAESIAFLEKIRPFQESLDYEKWEVIYTAAEQGSELQQLSHKHLRAD